MKGMCYEIFGNPMPFHLHTSFDDFMITDSVNDDAFSNFDVLNLGKSAITWGQLKDGFDPELNVFW